MTQSEGFTISVYDTITRDAAAGTNYRAAKTVVNTASGILHLVVSEIWEVNGGLKVAVYPDKDGEADMANLLNDCSFHGSTDDLVEATENYARRLAGGTAPKELFRDTQDAAIRSMEAMYQKLKK